MATTEALTTAYLVRPEGRIGYDIAGDGPLVVLSPGMGDLRATYRFLAPALRVAGYRVAAADLRGHGDSDASFASYGDVETAGDLAALITSLDDGPAIIVGNSMSAGAAVLVAAEHPSLVAGLVLEGPFVRDPAGSRFELLMFRAMMAPLWAGMMWKAYLPKLYSGAKPADFDAYRNQVAASFKRPGYATAFSQTTHLTHAPAEARLDDVSAPTLVVMGEQDPDFKDPAGEAKWIGETLKADVVMVSEAGHYPHSQQADIMIEAVLKFLREVAPVA